MASKQIDLHDLLQLSIKYLTCLTFKLLHGSVAITNFPGPSLEFGSTMAHWIHCHLKSSLIPRSPLCLTFLYIRVFLCTSHIRRASIELSSARPPAEQYCNNGKEGNQWAAGQQEWPPQRPRWAVLLTLHSTIVPHPEARSHPASGSQRLGQGQGIPVVRLPACFCHTICVEGLIYSQDPIPE